MNETKCTCYIKKEKPKRWVDRNADTLDSLESAICPKCDDSLFTVIEIKKNEEGA